MAPAWSIKAAALAKGGNKLRKYSGGVSRLRIVVQVVPPWLHEGAPTRSLSPHLQALRELFCRWSDFDGWPQRQRPTQILSQRIECGTSQWQQ